MPFLHLAIFLILFEQVRCKPSDFCNLHSSIVSGNFFPPVSGKNVDKKADNNALKANNTEGIAI